MEKFFADKANHSGQKSTSERKEEEEGGQRKATFPKGVVLGKDGKPYLPLFPLPLLLPFQFVLMARACVCVCVYGGVVGGRGGKEESE